MADLSLLSQLVSLREEDVLTVSIAHLLQRDKQFQRRYLDLLGVSPGGNCEIRPHPSYSECLKNRPDLEMVDKGRLAVFQENKIRSPETRGQFSRYAEQLSKRKEKGRLLVYVSQAEAPARLQNKKYPVPTKFIRWEQVAELLQGLPLTANIEVQWLRKGIYLFMEEKDMVAPAPLDIPKLRRHWPAFESQRKTLSRIIKDMVEDVQQSNGRAYKCSEGRLSGGFDFYVIPKTRKSAFRAVTSYKELWVCGGISTENDVIYVYAGIGWTKRHEQRIPDRVRIFLKSKEFEEDFNSYDGAECEEYYRSKSLTQLAGNSARFDMQSKGICRWMKEPISQCLEALRRVEASW